MMEMSKRKGKGVLEQCPYCKDHTLEFIFEGSDDGVHYEKDWACTECGRKFTEVWKAVEWFEI